MKRRLQVLDGYINVWVCAPLVQIREACVKKLQVPVKSSLHLLSTSFACGHTMHCLAPHAKKMQLFKTNQGTYLNNLITHNRISHPGKLMRTVCHFSASLLKRTPQKKFNAFILTILLAVHTIISTPSHKAISQDHVYVYFLQ